MNTENYKWPELKSETINGCRFYTTPSGQKYPSITTVIGQQPGKTHGLQQWKDRVGEEQANIISRKAARRGTAWRARLSGGRRHRLVRGRRQEAAARSFGRAGAAGAGGDTPRHGWRRPQQDKRRRGRGRGRPASSAALEQLLHGPDDGPYEERKETVCREESDFLR